jgi:hypothetical protein
MVKVDNIKTSHPSILHRDAMEAAIMSGQRFLFQGFTLGCAVALHLLAVLHGQCLVMISLLLGLVRRTADRLMSPRTQSRLEGLLRKPAIRVIKCGPVPEHVAFIMDGNRRFALKKRARKEEGHVFGFMKLEEVFPRWTFSLLTRGPFARCHLFHADRLVRWTIRIDSGLVHAARYQSGDGVRIQHRKFQEAERGSGLVVVFGEGQA